MIDPVQVSDPALAGESLLAVLGLRPFLARDHQRVLVGHEGEAHRLPQALAAELRAYINGDPVVRPVGRPEKVVGFDYLGIIEQLAQPVQPNDIEDMIGAHRDHSLAVDVFVALTRALAYLNGAAPRRFKQTLITSEPVKPSEQEIRGFARIFAVVDKPMTLLARLRAGTMLPDEVVAVSSVYPALYEVIGEAAHVATADRLQEKASFKLSRQQERDLRTLVGAGPQDPDLLKALQASYATGDQPQGDSTAAATANPGKLKLNSKSFRSGGERAESGSR